MPTSIPPAVDPANVQAARDAGLVYVSDLHPGISRQRSGSGFRYRDPDGAAVRDADTLARIRALAVPPAYTRVWICPRGNGHLQATGRDARQRKQYRYHPQWQQVRGAGKFDRIVAFGHALPRLRRCLRRDLALPGFPRDKVLAITVAVMADTLVRVGNDAYARSNRSYGLTTLRNRHIAFLRGGRAQLRFRGKGGLEHDITIDDRRLVALVRRCQQLPGQSLFQYRDDDGVVQPVDSGQLNDYLRAAMGEAFTAKDFRTWGATLEAFRQLAGTPVPGNDNGDAASERALAATETTVIAAVANALGNTPAVCRKAYIDPAVLAGWRDGRLHAAAAGARGARQWEQAALRFLRAARRAAAASSRAAARRGATRVRVARGGVVPAVAGRAAATSPAAAKARRAGSGTPRAAGAKASATASGTSRRGACQEGASKTAASGKAADKGRARAGGAGKRGASPGGAGKGGPPRRRAASG